MVGEYYDEEFNRQQIKNDKRSNDMTEYDDNAKVTIIGSDGTMRNMTYKEYREEQAVKNYELARRTLAERDAANERAANDMRAEYDRDKASADALAATAATPANAFAAEYYRALFEEAKDKHAELGAAMAKAAARTKQIEEYAKGVTGELSTLANSHETDAHEDDDDDLDLVTLRRIITIQAEERARQEARIAELKDHIGQAHNSPAWRNDLLIAKTKIGILQETIRAGNGSDGDKVRADYVSELEVKYREAMAWIESLEDDAKSAKQKISDSVDEHLLIYRQLHTSLHSYWERNGIAEGIANIHKSLSIHYPQSAKIVPDATSDADTEPDALSTDVVEELKNLRHFSAGASTQLGKYYKLHTALFDHWNKNGIAQGIVDIYKGLDVEFPTDAGIVSDTVADDLRRHVESLQIDLRAVTLRLNGANKERCRVENELASAVAANRLQVDELTRLRELNDKLIRECETAQNTEKNCLALLHEARRTVTVQDLQISAMTAQFKAACRQNAELVAEHNRILKLEYDGVYSDDDDDDDEDDDDDWDDDEDDDDIFDDDEEDDDNDTE